MNEAARRRLKNRPPKPVAGWFFAVAAVCGVVARVIHLSNGPQLVAEILIVIAVALAAVSLVLKLRNWLKSRAGK
ncbi:hypothetical protein AAFM46_10670 [Arthrobacter sp. TMP15]|uniref:hypothetical protein n=1 Tax=Arthrobacter sp. TMP15 TaxID=3140789 RepID=UPI0031BBA84E